MEDTWFSSKTVLQYKYLFRPVSVAIAICVSELKSIFANLGDNELYLQWYFAFAA